MPQRPRPTPEPPARRDPRLQRLDRLSYLLDNSIRLPGIGYRVGYDALLGLIPGVGDAVGLAFSVYIVFEAARYRLPTSTLLRMVLNVAVEALVGTLPLLGDVFDATWKANARNMQLLHDRLPGDRLRGRRADRRYLYGVMAALLLVAAVVGALIVAVVVALLQLLGL